VRRRWVVCRPGRQPRPALVGPLQAGLRRQQFRSNGGQHLLACLLLLGRTLNRLIAGQPRMRQLGLQLPDRLLRRH
jgi:hypothetical protein